MLRWSAILFLFPIVSGAQTVGAPSAASAAQDCNEVEAGTAQGYACLNRQLGAFARETARPSSLDAPVSATSPSNVTGQFNQAATRERLGANFGRSSIPARPTIQAPAPFAAPR